MDKKILMIFVDWFVPGFEAGGQIQSCANLVNALKNKFHIYVITRDRDLNAKSPYPSIQPDNWNLLWDNVNVYYSSPSGASYKKISIIIQTINPDVIYLNSMFSFRFSLIPIIASFISGEKKQIILAPRGMLQTGALKFKSEKKKFFLGLLNLSGISKKLSFHATDDIENKDISATFPDAKKVFRVDDFPSMIQMSFVGIPKMEGSLKCLFVSRIAPKKNLQYLLSALMNVKFKILLSIVGPVESESYWRECQHTISLLPGNVTVDFKGPIPNHLLSNIYLDHHIFALPTLGENFGHVIFDSFLNGRPVILSEHTPWRYLAEKNAGFDLPINDQSFFTTTIEKFANMEQNEFDTYCHGAWNLANEVIRNQENLIEEYVKMFSNN